jgi:hypothetical protein
MLKKAFEMELIRSYIKDEDDTELKYKVKLKFAFENERIKETMKLESSF